MTVFDQALNKVLGHEGGFSNDPADSGGATRYGITEVLARRHGYAGPMAAFPLDKAREIYRVEFWGPLRLSDVAETSAPVAIELFEQAVNLGPRRAGQHLQTALNAFNQQGALWADLQVDGDIGPATLRALFAYRQRRREDGDRVLVAALNALQGAFYLDLVRLRQKDERFVYGWFLQRVAA